MTQNWRTIIVDDEELARSRLVRLLKPYKEFDLVGEASNGQEGLEKIGALAPDLVFLDIEMPVLGGLEMLARLETQPHIVFTTAYDQYAIRAFEENSVDYLLKPVQTERLEKTVEKLRRVMSGENSSELTALLKKLQPQQQLRSLTVKTGDRIFLIKLQDIIFIEAKDKYVFICTLDGRQHITEYVLADLEKTLPVQFLRIHRGTIINTDHIREIRRDYKGAFEFVMQGTEKKTVTSGRTYGDGLKKHFGL